MSGIRRPGMLRLATVLMVVCLVMVGPGQAQTESRATVKNMLPQVVSVTVLSDDDPNTGGAQVDPVAGGNRTVSFEVAVEDGNHHLDIKAVDCTLYDAAESTAPVGAPSFLEGVGKTGLWAFTATVAYHQAAGQWRILCLARDATLDTADQWSPLFAEGFFEVRELAAIAIDQTSVAYTGDDGIEPGQRTTPTEIVVENLGNIQVDLEIGGSDLAGEQATIGGGNQRHGRDAAMTNATTMTASPALVNDFDLVPGQGSTMSRWFDLRVPSGDEQFIPAGSYTGTVTLRVVADGGA